MQVDTWAKTLEQSLGPRSNFHERAQGVGDATHSSKVRLGFA